jgi:hypothetical protein
MAVDFFDYTNACALQLSEETRGQTADVRNPMPNTVTIKSERLSVLERRKRTLQHKIAQEMRRLRDQSRKRAVIRARVIGETVLQLREQGRLPEGLFEQILDVLLARVEGNNVEFEALQGSVFDLTALLYEGSKPIEAANPQEEMMAGD